MMRKLIYRVGLPAVLAVATALGVWAAVDQHQRVAPTPEKDAGARISVVKVEGDPVQVRVTIRVETANSKGGAVTFGPTFLVSGDTAVPLLRSSANADDPSLITLTFPPLDFGKMVLRLGPTYPAGNPERPAKNALAAAQEFELPGGEQLAGAATVPSGVQDLFPSGLAPSVEKVTFSGSGTLVQGHLNGLTASQVAAITVTSRVTTNDGNDVPIVVGRYGFGAGLAQFSLLYPAVDQPATLEMKIRADPMSPAFAGLTAEDRAELASLEQASITWSIAR